MLLCSFISLICLLSQFLVSFLFSIDDLINDLICIMNITIDRIINIDDVKSHFHVMGINLLLRSMSLVVAVLTTLIRFDLHNLRSTARLLSQLLLSLIDKQQLVIISFVFLCLFVFCCLYTILYKDWNLMNLIVVHILLYCQYWQKIERVFYLKSSFN